MEEVVIINPEHTGWFRLHSSKVLYLVVALIFVGILGYLLVEKKHEASTIAYSVGRIDGSILYTYDSGKKQLEIFQLPNEAGNKLPVIDLIKNFDNSSYYILLEKEDAPTSNIFFKSPDGSVVRLTNSDSFKTHLTVDQPSGQLAYQSAHVDSVRSLSELRQWDLVLFGIQNKTEKVIGAGEAPVLLPGEGSLLFSSEQGLRRLTLQGNTVSPVLLRIPKKQLYSISPTTGGVVVFNEMSNTLDFYSFSKTGSPDYVKSQPVNEKPSLVEYVGSDIFTVVSTLDKQGNKSYRITSNDNKTTIVQGPNAVSEILKITNL